MSQSVLASFCLMFWAEDGPGLASSGIYEAQQSSYRHVSVLTIRLGAALTSHTAGMGYIRS